MDTFKTRADATARLRELGIPMSNSALANLASQKRGPRFTVINGRALYTDRDLTGWIAQQVASGGAS